MKQIKPHLALLACNSIWAINYPFYHILYTKAHITAAAMLSLSLLAAALFAFVPLLWSRGERIERADLKYIFAAAVLSGLMRKGLVIFGLSLTSPIDASIIASLLPIMALVISVLMRIDRFTPSRVVGILLGMGGVMAIILSGGKIVGNPSQLSGNLIMLLYTVAAGFYMVWLQPIFKKYKPITQLRYIYSISALMFLPFGLPDIIHFDFSQLPAHYLYLLLFVVLVPTFLPNLLLNYALARVTPTVSSIYSYLQPLLAIGVTLYLGLGRLHWSTLLFGLIIVGGVTLVVRSYSRGATSR